jgi:hypothetical protein
MPITEYRQRREYKGHLTTKNTAADAARRIAENIANLAVLQRLPPAK